MFLITDFVCVVPGKGKTSCMHNPLYRAYSFGHMSEMWVALAYPFVLLCLHIQPFKTESCYRVPNRVFDIVLRHIQDDSRAICHLTCHCVKWRMSCFTWCDVKKTDGFDMTSVEQMTSSVKGERVCSITFFFSFLILVRPSWFWRATSRRRLKGAWLESIHPGPILRCRRAQDRRHM